jgi:heptosyltransferase-2
MSSENKFISTLLLYKRTCPSITKLSDSISDISILAKYGINNPFVVMAPFCSVSSAWHKQWPVDHYLEVAKHIQKRGYQVVVFGSKNDESCVQIQKSEHIHSLIGKTELQDLIQLMPHASIAIGNDTGIMHLAELCQIPTIVIMSGVNDPNKAPKGPLYIQLLETPITDISVHKVIAAFDDVSLKSQ